MNSIRFRRIFEPIAHRIFTPEYLSVVSGLDAGSVPDDLTDEAIRLIASLIMSPGRLKALIRIADPVILAAVHSRHLQVDTWLFNNMVDINYNNISVTDGAVTKFLLIDLYHSLPPF